MVAVPNSSATGVMVTVRFAPLPPSTTFALGNSVVFDETRVSVSEEEAVSVSPTVNEISFASPSSFIS